jgi:N-acetyl-alpha-D-muramate 1-phosphate uridylyltransferase
MLPVAILAGGLATRLRPITETIPKALIEIAGEPFICHQLRYLKGQGIASVVLCIGYRGEMIQERIGDGAEFGVRVCYSFDGPKLLGTGGAIKAALPLLGESFYVFYGDSYLPISFNSVENAYLKSKKFGLMTVLKNDNQWDKSNVIFKNNYLIEYNKETIKPNMTYIDYGLGILSAKVFEDYAGFESFDLSKVYNELSIKNQLYGYEIFERFYEIGSHQGILETEDYLTSREKK